MSTFKKLLGNLASLLGWSTFEAPSGPVMDTTQALRNARLQAHMRALQLKSVLSNLTVSLLATVGVSALAAWALSRYVSLTVNAVWLGVVVVSVAIRLWHRYYVQRELVEDARWLSEQLNWVRL